MRVHWQRDEWPEIYCSNGGGAGSGGDDSGFSNSGWGVHSGDPNSFGLPGMEVGGSGPTSGGPEGGMDPGFTGGGSNTGPDGIGGMDGGGTNVGDPTADPGFTDRGSVAVNYWGGPEADTSQSFYDRMDAANAVSGQVGLTNAQRNYAQMLEGQEAAMANRGVQAYAQALPTRLPEIVVTSPPPVVPGTPDPDPVAPPAPNVFAPPHQPTFINPRTMNPEPRPRTINQPLWSPPPSPQPRSNQEILDIFQDIPAPMTRPYWISPPIPRGPGFPEDTPSSPVDPNVEPNVEPNIEPNIEPTPTPLPPMIITRQQQIQDIMDRVREQLQNQPPQVQTDPNQVNPIDLGAPDDPSLNPVDPSRPNIIDLQMTPAPPLQISPQQQHIKDIIANRSPTRVTVNPHPPTIPTDTPTDTPTDPVDNAETPTGDRFASLMAGRYGGGGYSRGGYDLSSLRSGGYGGGYGGRGIDSFQSGGGTTPTLRTTAQMPEFYRKLLAERGML